MPTIKNNNSKDTDTYQKYYSALGFFKRQRLSTEKINPAPFVIWIQNSSNPGKSITLSGFLKQNYF